MADCQGDCVSRVVRPGNRRQRAESADHFHHLSLFRPSISGNGLLNLHGSVFKNRYPGMFTGQQNNTASVRNRDSGSNIIRKEKFFNGNGIRRKHLQQFREISINSAQAGGETCVGGSCNYTAFFESKTVALIGHNAESDGSYSGINSDNSQTVSHSLHILAYFPCPCKHKKRRRVVGVSYALGCEF